MTSLARLEILAASFNKIGLTATCENEQETTSTRSTQASLLGMAAHTSSTSGGSNAQCGHTLFAAAGNTSSGNGAPFTADGSSRSSSIFGSVLSPVFRKVKPGLSAAGAAAAGVAPGEPACQASAGACLSGQAGVQGERGAAAAAASVVDPCAPCTAPPSAAITARTIPGTSTTGGSKAADDHETAGGLQADAAIDKGCATAHSHVQARVCPCLKTVAMCPMLTSLNLSHNQIQALPGDLPGALTQLTSLDLTNNRLVGQDTQGARYQRTKWLDIAFCSLNSRDLSMVSSFGPALLVFTLKVLRAGIVYLDCHSSFAAFLIICGPHFPGICLLLATQLQHMLCVWFTRGESCPTLGAPRPE